jgi:hypothetical protein
MSNPHHGEDVIDRGGGTGTENHDPNEKVPENGYYRAFRRHPRELLGGMDRQAGDVFGCWPSPRVCDVLWFGPC